MSGDTPDPWSSIDKTRSVKKRKRPLNGYQYFVKTRAAKIRRHLADGAPGAQVTCGTMLGEVGAAWKALSNDERREFGVLAKEWETEERKAALADTVPEMTNESNEATRQLVMAEKAEDDATEAEAEVHTKTESEETDLPENEERADADAVSDEDEGKVEEREEGTSHESGIVDQLVKGGKATKVKRLSGYHYFAKVHGRDLRQQVCKEEGVTSVSYRMLGPRLGAAWRELTDEERAGYGALAQEAYGQALKEAEADTTPPDSDGESASDGIVSGIVGSVLQQEEGTSSPVGSELGLRALRSWRGNKRGRQQASEHDGHGEEKRQEQEHDGDSQPVTPQRRKRPLNGYQYFVKLRGADVRERLCQERDTTWVAFSEIIAEVAAAWRVLTDDERAAYGEQARLAADQDVVAPAPAPPPVGEGVAEAVVKEAYDAGEETSAKKEDSEVGAKGESEGEAKQVAGGKAAVLSWEDELAAFMETMSLTTFVDMDQSMKSYAGLSVRCMEEEANMVDTGTPRKKRGRPRKTVNEDGTAVQAKKPTMRLAVNHHREGCIAFWGCDVYTKSTATPTIPEVDHIIEVQVLDQALVQAQAALKCTTGSVYFTRSVTAALMNCFNSAGWYILPTNLNVTSKAINRAKWGPITRCLNRMRKGQRQVPVSDLAIMSPALTHVWHGIECAMARTHELSDRYLESLREAGKATSSTITGNQWKALPEYVNQLHAVLFDVLKIDV